MSVCSIRRMDKLVYCEDLSWRERVFRDRFEGGEVLAGLLADVGLGKDVIVYGLAAGGVPVAYSVARKLGAVMDVVVVKKILYPWTTEAGFGAVAPDGLFEYSGDAAVWLGYTQRDVEALAAKTHERVVERMRLFRGSERIRLSGQTVVVVDDGIATGYTMRVALTHLLRSGAGRVVAAAPTASTDGAMLVAEKAERVIVVNLRSPPYAVADAYEEWHDVSDEEVLEILEKARAEGIYRVFS